MLNTRWSRPDLTSMKTPERWCALTRRALLVSILAQKSHIMTSWHHVVTSRDVETTHHDILCHHNYYMYVMTKWICTGQPIRTSKITFFNMASLTFDLPTHPRYCQGRHPYEEFGSVCQTVQPWESWQTHTQTDRRERFYTLDRWRGRE